MSDTDARDKTMLLEFPTIPRAKPCIQKKAYTSDEISYDGELVLL